ncbi:glycosyl transferase [Desulfosporosinus orientis DSM 765]|uniref:Glycosyl transferase n=1 Tax=Desulfosporosinus orientis (strain ATCC 19365 / DSM 765 / NCIMB 8382 / VKM B-1628 / Singapore I) TaxID=768706 RepID=G7WIL1_DESOD|nr:glycosyltransferase family 2 protein [Desulfosporosinus orientis]AET69085.1 glycosyl transferase [Desulfosporosinus orientis DSM 765]
MNSGIRYSIVIPVYNEEAVIEQTYRRLKQVMASTGESYELIFVNDGSRDQTASLIKGYGEGDDTVKLLGFSRNFGHQVAITAGMDYAAGAAVVVIDADLQDPPELILEMIAKWKEGFDVVYAKRTKRKGETFFKKQTAHLFYRLLRVSTDLNIPTDTGDFRLIDRRVVEELKRLPERNRYVRGLVSWVGFRQTAVEYERDERLAGETKYPLKKMMKLSMDGITSFSYKPLKLATYAGTIIVTFGLSSLAVLIFMKMFNKIFLAGWELVISIQLILSGLLLTMMGIIGEYIGRIYDEARERPLYIISESYGLMRKEQPVKKERTVKRIV